MSRPISSTARVLLPRAPNDFRDRRGNSPMRTVVLQFAAALGVMLVAPAGAYAEECPSGYTGTWPDCVDVDECLVKNGGCNRQTVCTNVPGTRECGPCPSGFTGSGETTCT